MNETKPTYLEALGFSRQPFDKKLSLKHIFHSKQIKELFERLNLFLGRRGIAMVTGEIGAGKSTAIRAFVENLESNRYDLAYIDDPTIGMRGILNSMANQLNLEAGFFKWQLTGRLKVAIEKNFENYNKATLLIIDEAQLLTPKILEELRMFTNFKIDSQCPLNLILLGQPELNKIIRLNSMKALFQRINCRYHISGLDESEISDYMMHHLQIAGRTDPLFDVEVISEIFQHAQGIPRMINNLSYQCLIGIFRQNKSKVDIPTLEAVLLNWDF
jgi:type II secretory pathway predicted ATPase ExeA